MTDDLLHDGIDMSSAMSRAPFLDVKLSRQVGLERHRVAAKEVWENCEVSLLSKSVCEEFAVLVDSKDVTKKQDCFLAFLIPLCGCKIGGNFSLSCQQGSFVAYLGVGESLLLSICPTSPSGFPSRANPVRQQEPGGLDTMLTAGKEFCVYSSLSWLFFLPQE